MPDGARGPWRDPQTPSGEWGAGEIKKQMGKNASPRSGSRRAEGGEFSTGWRDTTDLQPLSIGCAHAQEESAVILLSMTVLSSVRCCSPARRRSWLHTDVGLICCKANGMDSSPHHP